MANKTYILYHADCHDGFGSAYAAWKSLGYTAIYLPVQHGYPMPAIPDGADVYIQDFAYSRGELLKLGDRCQVTVLDHHKTAMNDLSGLAFAVFNLNKSGATLAWEHWHSQRPVPELLRYIEDRDLQRLKLPESQNVHYALLSYPMDFEVWDLLTVEQLKIEGRAIARFAEQLIEKICRNVMFREIGGYPNIPTVNSSVFMLEVKARLCEQYPNAPFTAYFFDRSDGKRQWGLRANGDFDVSEVSGRLGGGGHRLDAGFAEVL
ncbi:MAG: phosphoesterase [Cyanobacteria bacterium J06626_18]